ncbi:MAG: hypothetical protein IJV27_06090 [Prevotella sp.]|nr:hypothetical protein [Prevotella sp.]
MEYDKEILQILMEVGEKGLSVSKISHHVYNSCNSFFRQVSYEDIHKYVAQYLLKNSKNPDSFIEKTDRGIYHLNLKSQETQQLMLKFGESKQQNEEPITSKDFSLNLFSF